MNTTISPEVRTRIDAHLDAVERQLDASGVPREKRRGIMDDLETHILEMLDAAGNRVITPAEVNEILGRLDPPEAYGKEIVQPVQAPAPATLKSAEEPELCRQARQGIGWIALALLAQAVFVSGFLVGHTHTVHQAPTYVPSDSYPVAQRPGMMIFMIVVVIAAIVAPIIGTSLGWIALERIRNSGRKLYGLVLATFEALFYPLIVIWIGALVLWYWIVVAYYDGPEVPNRGRAICLIGGLCTAMVLSVILGWLLHRLSRESASPSKGSSVGR